MPEPSEFGNEPFEVIGPLCEHQAVPPPGEGGGDVPAYRLDPLPILDQGSEQLLNAQVGRAWSLEPGSVDHEL